MIAHDRASSIGAQSQHHEAVDPTAAMRIILLASPRVARAYESAHAATFRRNGFPDISTHNAHVTIIGTPRPTDDSEWPPPLRHSPHVSDAVSCALSGAVACPAMLSVHLVRARPDTHATVSSVLPYPSATPLTLTPVPGVRYRLDIAILIRHGSPRHPRYSILARNDVASWRHTPYGAPPTMLTNDAAVFLLLNPDPNHTNAAALVYRLEPHHARAFDTHDIPVNRQQPTSNDRDSTPTRIQCQARSTTTSLPLA